MISFTALAQNLTLGTDSLTFGHTAGSGTLVISATGDWTACTGAPWIHIPDASAKGSGSAIFQFTYDANLGPTRTGTIRFSSGATLAVTQASLNYVPSYELTALVSSGLSTSPSGLAVDSDGNVYVASGGSGVKEWIASSGQLATLVPEVSSEAGVAVDSVGNLYFPDVKNRGIGERDAQTGQITVLISGLASVPNGVAVDISGNVYFCAGNAVEEWNGSTGQVTTLISSGLNSPGGIAVDTDANLYIADAGPGPDFRRNRIQKWTAATGQLTTIVTEPVFQLALAVDGDGNVYFSEFSGGGVVREWTASTGQVTSLVYTDKPASGIAVDGANNVYFALGSNIYRWSAGSGDLTPLIATALNYPNGVALDEQGNVYIADEGPFVQNAANINAVQDTNAVKKWTAATGTVTTLLSSGLTDPLALAVNSAGDLFIADRGQLRGQVLQWSAATGQVTPILSEHVYGLALDRLGNLYLDDVDNQAIEKWTPATGELTTLIPSGGVPGTDILGNVYFADAGGIEEWAAATGAVTTLISSGPVLSGIAVDGSGTVYFNASRSGVPVISKWAPDTKQVTGLLPGGLISSQAIDGFGNIYFTDDHAVKKLTQAFVAPLSFVEPLTAGTDQFLPVLPVGTPLDAKSDQAWLTITSQADGVVAFSFSAAGTERTGHITLLGQTIAVTQRDNTLPAVVSYSVLWGLESYVVTGSQRNNLPWQISGIQVLFSRPIAAATVASLRGVQATALSGLGTNTLTWTIDPVAVGSFALTLAQDGPDAVMDADGNTLTGNVSQNIRVLWGDYNDDSKVDASDLNFPLIGAYNISSDVHGNGFGDMDGNGLVDSNDVEIVRTRISSTLP